MQRWREESDVRIDEYERLAELKRQEEEEVRAEVEQQMRERRATKTVRLKRSRAQGGGARARYGLHLVAVDLNCESRNAFETQETMELGQAGVAGPCDQSLRIGGGVQTFRSAVYRVDTYGFQLGPGISTS